MRFSVCVRTAPREVDYFTHMRARLRSLIDPYVVGLFISDNASVTPNENACLALEGALKNLAGESDDEWVMFLEDDIEFIDDFFRSTQRWLKDHHSPTVHFYPLACNYSQCFDPRKTFWEYRTEAYYGSQGLLIRASQVQSLVDYVRTQQVGRGFDLAVARWHRLVEPEQDFILTPVPCFIDHVGDVSTLGCAVGHFAGFGGRGYSYPPKET